MKTAWTLLADAVVVSIRLTPKSAYDQVDGVETLADGKDVLKVRVRAVPEKGKANKALLKLLAKSLGLPQRDLELTAGETSRLKTIRVAGDPIQISAALAKLTQQG